MRNKLKMRSVGNKMYLRIPSQITLKINVFTRRFVIVPAEKREEFLQILSDMISRLLKLINARKTETRVRLKAMTVLNELLNTSYTMVRDVEVEELERETEGHEQEESGSCACWLHPAQARPFPEGVLQRRAFRARSGL